ncbi:VapE domain-containing protein [Sphingopyxis sp.]|jgi:putative DNA primase/helicase|uniref:VapE domain-containing protein n=1 Tax=Sphingopyxis sp. TaxID=1908224 RepID=UPI002E09F8DA|nr:VapE domain-containing protein [Sphingopyxis sp.]
MDSIRKASPRLNDGQRPAPSEADRKKPTPIQMARAAHLASTHLKRPAGTNKIDTRSLPDQPAHGNVPPLTVGNLRHVLTKYGITVRYNVIKKDVEIVHPDHTGTIDNALNVTEAKIVSLVAAHGMSTTHVGAFLVVIADENPFNPAEDWIRSKPWDGVNRLPDFFETLQVEEGYDKSFRNLLMRKWLLSATAAALLKSGFKTRGVLTLQGAQGIGKTSWLKSLVPEPALADSLVKLDHHLDGGSKDSILTAIRHWLVEIGELGSTFRRDVERLKGILTNDIDKVRQPYAKQDSTYPRRTVFIATVNDDTFLVDGTGNRRWWTIRVASINYAHGIDMQQVFAQMAQALESGEVWWLNSSAEEQLDAINRQHMASSVVRDLVLSHIDHEVKDPSGSPAFTPTELLKYVEISNPSNAQVKECAQLLRELFGEPKRIRGSNKWRVPLLKVGSVHDDDKRSEASTVPLPQGKSKFD